MADPERRTHWKVLGRIIYIQLENQIHFEGEKEVFQHFSFQDPNIENFQKLQRQIAEKENANIFLYSIEPIGHEERPLNGEKLYVQ